MSLPLGQEPSNTDGQEPTDSTTTAPAAPPRSQEPPERYDAAYVADLRKSEAATRKRAAELEARLKEMDDAKLSETERLTKRTAELEAQLLSAQTAQRQERIRSVVMDQAHEAGAVKATTVYSLLRDAGFPGIELDDSGEVKGAEKAVKALLEAEPYLKAGTPNGSAGPNPTPKGSGPPSRDQLVTDLYERMRTGAFPRL